jgi:hypothetical protein
MYQKILTAELKISPHMSVEAFDLVKGMLRREPSSRLGANGIKDIKSHPFFASIDWDKLVCSLSY